MNYSFSKDFIFKVLIFFIHALLLWHFVEHHEMWRDEYHSLQIARSSKTFWQLFNNVRFEGHPILWYALLKFLPLKYDLIGIQILNYILLELAVFVLIFRSPFNLFIVILTVFSYLFLYEYGVFARNYAVGLLFLFLFLSYLDDIKNHKILLVLFACLAISSNICIIFIFISFSFSIKSILNQHLSSKHANLVFGLIYSVLFLNLLYIFLPQIFSRIEIINGLLSTYKLLIALLTIFVCVAIYFTQNWVNNFIKNSNLHFKLIFGFILNSILILAFFKFVYPGSIRHYGHIFIGFLVYLWMSNIYFENEKRHSQRLNILFLIAFLVQIGFEIRSIKNDWFKEYSGISRAASFIRSQGLENNVLAGKPLFILEGLATELKKDSFYGYASKAPVKFVNWKAPKSPNEVNFGLLEYWSKNLKKDIIVYANTSLDKYLNDVNFKKLFSSTNVISDETVNLYIFKYQELNERHQ